MCALACCTSCVLWLRFVCGCACKACADLLPTQQHLGAASLSSCDSCGSVLLQTPSWMCLPRVSDCPKLLSCQSIHLRTNDLIVYVLAAVGFGAFILINDEKLQASYGK